jgi:hypothetical protein
MIKVLTGPKILAGQSLSEPLDCTAGQMVRIHVPDSWTGNPLTFQISVDGVLWNDLFDADGFEVTVKAVVPGTAVIVQKHAVQQVWVRFRSGSRAQPQPQNADCEFLVAIELATAGTHGACWVPVYGWMSTRTGQEDFPHAPPT